MKLKDIQKKAAQKGLDLAIEQWQSIHNFAQEHCAQEKTAEALEVTSIILDITNDTDTVMASMLLKCADLERAPFDAITEQFGTGVTDVIQGLHKLTVLSMISLQNPQNHADALRKMFLALAQDIRVVFIKLANRLYTLRTINAAKKTAPPEKERLFAQEVFELYAPLAARLSMYRMKHELENVAFQIAFPKQYASVQAQTDHLLQTYKNFLGNGKKELEKILQEANVAVTVQGRVKDAYSIFQKLQKKETRNITDIHDVFAFRVLTENVPDCYSVLGKIHQHWKVLPGRFKDYIAVPKPNGYASLHTTIVAPLGDNEKPYHAEVQIRTVAMHEEAEYGSAVHWRYKEKDEAPTQKNWFSALAKNISELPDNDEFQAFAKDFLGDSLFVLTEKGDIQVLPENATPIDFAYAIHTDIGHHCNGAIVNEKIVPLHHQLENGDVVKILINKQSVPKQSWLSFVASSRARQKIRAFLRQHDKEFFLRTGRDALNSELQKLGGEPLDSKYTLLQKYEDLESGTLKDRENLLHRIGIGDLSAHIVAKKVLGTPMAAPRQRSFVATKKKVAGVIVAGEPGYRHKIAQCCSPKAPENIIAFTTRAGSFTIHSQNCSMLNKLDPARFLSARWETDPDPTYLHLALESSYQRVHLVSDISDIFSRYGLHMVKIHYSGMKAPGVQTTIFITAEILRRNILEQFLEELEKVSGVQKVYEIGEEEIPYN